VHSAQLRSTDTLLSASSSLVIASAAAAATVDCSRIIVTLLGRRRHIHGNYSLVYLLRSKVAGFIISGLTLVYSYHIAIYLGLLLARYVPNVAKRSI